MIENLQNELISFLIIAVVVLALAYMTHRVEKRYKDDEE